MSIKIGTLNAREALARPQLMLGAVEAITRLDSDVAVISDAYSLDNEAHESSEITLQGAYDLLELAGYQVLEQTPYEDEEPWVHSRNIILLSRMAVENSGVVRLGTRNAVEARVVDKETKTPVHIVGAHFDDRNEQARIVQARAFRDHAEWLDYLYTSASPNGFTLPKVLAGDLNSAPEDALSSRLIRVAGPLAKSAMSGLARLPINSLQSKTIRNHSNIERAIEIADGHSIGILRRTGRFRDADSCHRPTFPANIPTMQLDRYMITPELSALEITVHDPVEGLDHRGVSVTLAT